MFPLTLRRSWQDSGLKGTAPHDPTRSNACHWHYVLSLLCFLWKEKAGRTLCWLNTSKQFNILRSAKIQALAGWRLYSWPWNQCVSVRKSAPYGSSSLPVVHALRLAEEQREGKLPSQQQGNYFKLVLSQIGSSGIPRKNQPFKDSSSLVTSSSKYGCILSWTLFATVLFYSSCPRRAWIIFFLHFQRSLSYRVPTMCQARF